MFELHDVDRPYPGLRQFESWETEIFFGRRKHTERLLEILDREHFVAVIGPSGSGKSSLVRAGLLPELPLGRLHTGTRWRIATMRPGNEPVRRLARALLRPEAFGEVLLDAERIPPTPDAQTLEVALAEAELRRGQFGLIELAAQAARRQASADASIGVERPPLNLLLLVDQFEELFTHLDVGTGDLEARRTLAEESDAFVNLLLSARAAREARIFVVITMRTDFLGACVRFSELPDAINRAQYLTPRLQREEIALAITGPARHFGGEVDPVVVQELINAVGTDSDQLPLLQHALSRMWAFASRRAGPGEPVHIAQQDFEEAGGVRDALARHADSVLASLCGLSAVPEPLRPEQVLARELFCAITEQRSADSGGQTVRRPRALAVIAERAGRVPEDYFPVVHAFGDEPVNFLACQGPLGPDTVIDISHEALIRQWPRLAGWVADEARRAGEYRRLRRQARAFFAGEVGAAMLGGAALARALEWMNGGGAASDDDWRPSAAWAARYARDATPDGQRAEFEQVARFIRESADDAAAAERRAAREQEQRRQAEKAEIERRAAMALLAEKDLRMRAERKRADEARQSAARQRRMSKLLLVAAAVAIALAAYSAVLKEQANDRRRLVETQAHVLRGRALWLPLAIESGRLSAKDADALLRVLRADGENLSAFATQLRDEEFLAERFVREPAPLLAAMVGPGPAAREAMLSLFERRPAAAGADAAARLLARAFLRAALVEDSAADMPLAQDVAAAAVGYSDDDREGWRVFGRALSSLTPDMRITRRRALFEALDAAARDPAATPAQSLTLSVGMGVLSGYAPEAELGHVYDRLLSASLNGVEAEVRRGVPLAQARPLGGAEELPVIGSRRDALVLLLIRLAGRLPPEDARQRWRVVQEEIRLRRGARKAFELGAAAPAGANASPLALRGEASRRGLDRRDLVQLLPGLARRLAPGPAAAAYDEVTRVLIDEFWAPRGTHRDPDENDTDIEVGAYGMALAPLALALTPERAAAEATRLLDRVTQRGRPESTREAFLMTLVGLVERMEGPAAVDFAARLGKANWDSEDAAFHDEPSRDDARRLWAALRSSLPAGELALAPGWALDASPTSSAPAPRAPGGARAQPAAGDGALSVAEWIERISAIDDTDSDDALPTLDAALAAAVQRAPAAQLAANAQSLHEALLRARDADQRGVLARALQATAARLDPTQAGALRHRIAAEMNADASVDARAQLWAIYEGLVPSGSIAERRAIAHELLTLIETAHAPVSVAGETLLQIAGQFEAADRMALLRDVVSAMAHVPESPLTSADPSLNVVRSAGLWREDAVPAERMKALEPIAVALAPSVAQPERDDMREGVIGAILASHSMAAADALGRVLRGLGGDTEAERRRAVAQFMATLPRCARAQDVSALAAAARWNLDQQPASYEVARDMFELMKYPSSAREAAASVRAKFAEAPGADAGLWALVGWARKTWPALPLDARPQGA